MRKVFVLFLLLVPSLGTADLKDFDHPLVLKPYAVRDGITFVADENHWIRLPWSNFVAIGQDKLLFKVDGVIYTCPMEGYKCDQIDDALRVEDKE